MANLHVQPKRKNYVWIWILIIIILIIAVGIYYYLNYYSTGTTPSVDNALHNTSLQLKTAAVLITGTSTVL